MQINVQIQSPPSRDGADVLQAGIKHRRWKAGIFDSKILSNKTTQTQVRLIRSIIAHTADKGIKMVDVFTATQMDKGTMITYIKLHKYCEPTWNKKKHL